MKKRWFTAVTTAPRMASTLENCVCSIKEAGWREIAVFAEPGSPGCGLPTVRNERRLGPWHNWLQAMNWALRHSEADYILSVQDDALIHPDAKRFLESMPELGDDAAFVSLYTPSHFSFDWSGIEERDPGINEVTHEWMWGAVALAFRRDVLRRIVNHEIAASWYGPPPARDDHVSDETYQIADSILRKQRLAEPDSIAGVDTAIGVISRDLGLKWWFIDPSLATHSSKYSTLGHGGNSGKRGTARSVHRDRSAFDFIPMHVNSA